MGGGEASGEGQNGSGRGPSFKEDHQSSGLREKSYIPGEQQAENP